MRKGKFAQQFPQEGRTLEEAGIGRWGVEQTKCFRFSCGSSWFIVMTGVYRPAPSEIWTINVNYLRNSWCSTTAESFPSACIRAFALSHGGCFQLKFGHNVTITYIHACECVCMCLVCFRMMMMMISLEFECIIQCKILT